MSEEKNVQPQEVPATEEKKYPYEVKPGEAQNQAAPPPPPPPPQGQPAQAQPQTAQAQPQAANGPLTPEEAKKNAIEKDKQTMRVLQVIQHQEGQRIEIHPIQNVSYRSDIIGILSQALNNIQNEDQLRNTAALMRESISILRSDINKPAKPATQPDPQANQAGQ